MTEEIIIDGVDVAGCKFYDKRAVLYDCTEDTTSGDNDCYRCKDEPNCYYKQLKRLEQENFALTQESQQKSQTICKLEQENKELKKFFDSAVKKNTRLENKMKEYHEQYDELYWTTDQLVKDKTRLKQTLEEIRRFAGRRFVNGLNAEADHYNKDMQAIEDKINEVLQ